MTEWDAHAYNQVSALQRWLAAKSLASLQFDGDGRILDLGCGDGSITAAIAARQPRGTVLGVDASRAMIAFAAQTFPPATHPNLTFQIVDAAQLPFADAFDLIVSFNCLHWVRDQAAALRGIRAALAPGGRVHLRLVARGARQSLEAVIEETRRSAAWAPYFADYQTPYLHLTPDEYSALARESGLRVERTDVQQEAWDFESRPAFVHFAEATFVEWTRLIPAAARADFIAAVLDRYRQLGDGTPAHAHVFTFYQMEVVARRDR
jgi:trans-aconitate 2-methyltransferase